MTSYTNLNYPFTFTDTVENFYHTISNDKNISCLFVFFVSNLLFVAIEFLCGLWWRSVGVILDSLNMFFDCVGLLPSLCALFVMKWRRDDKYTFGYVKAEVMSNLVNGLFSVYIAFFVLTEAVKRYMEHNDATREHFLHVCTLRLVMNVTGLLVFGINYLNKPQKVCKAFEYQRDIDHSPNDNYVNSLTIFNDNEIKQTVQENTMVMKGVSLHLLADTLKGAGDLSATIFKTYSWITADMILSLVIAVLIISSVASLIMESVVILLQRQPKSLDYELPLCYQKLLQLDGVYSVQEPHFWTLCGDTFVGSLKLEVSKSADYRYVVSHTNTIFSSAGVKQLYIQLDYSAL